MERMTCGPEPTKLLDLESGKRKEKKLQINVPSLSWAM